MALPKEHDQRSPEGDQVSERSLDGAQPRVAGFEEDCAPAASPARVLQSQLHAHFSPEIAPVWTRYVTLFVALCLFGGWLTTAGLYTVL